MVGAGQCPLRLLTSGPHGQRRVHAGEGMAAVWRKQAAGSQARRTGGNLDLSL